MLKKLKKAVIFFLSVLMIFSIPAGPALAGPPASLEEAKAAANQELLEKFGVPDYFTNTNISGKPLRRHELAEPGYGYYVLTWGDPHGDIRDGHRRYVGYTKLDEDFTNPTFPHDAWAGGKLEDRNWIRYPWDNKELQQRYNIKGNKFDGRPELLWHIQAGLIIKYSDVSLLAQSPMWEHWHEYVHIMVPPTEYSWGMGRMWHKLPDGSIWYISIPLAPKALDIEKPDFSVTLDKHQVQAKTGDTIEFVATFALNADHPRAETAKLTAFHVVGGSQFQVTLEPLGSADKLNSDGTIEFQPGEQKKFKIRVTAQGQKSKVVVKINPWSVAYDANWANNSDEALITVEKLPPPSTGSGELVLQAYSYPGKDLRGNYQPSKPRPVNTAKWSDDVTATLTVKKPRPPRGTLDWWEISSAKLTYPKRNPSFSFGRPLPPQGTVTVNMKVPGRADPDTDELKATAKFVEDWAMDGFPVYSMIDGKQLTTEKPKDYPVTATYTVRYQYHYVVCDEDGDCETIYVTAEDTRTATQNLRVTGAGTVPYAS
ncbi:hypothetical protein J2Z49_002616 [Desulfofundulus luciae]|uniref:Uncharacterized protein n=1 Tax=Desulfofundulus luciae TaxID=74702 RepID=A0ABU0B436_9FIRM|nr:hypothetical protein [Desulfofundulus luciae]MDQ0287488.1 hypothetical protein [Desulfofundulus luciae]